MNEKNIEHRVSQLNKTWIFDLDGTLVKHNGYKLDGYDTFLPGAKEYLNMLPKEDMIIIVTSRQEEYRGETIRFLAQQEIRYNHIIFNAPYGERILVNDRKVSGLSTAIGVNTRRDEFMQDTFITDTAL